MKKALFFILLFLVACKPHKNAPTEPNIPSYSDLPIASYTVTAPDNAAPSGDIPIGTFASYRSTYNRKNQLTAGNSATLTLTGMTGVKVRSITLHMRSNKSSGAGSLSVTNDQNPIWTIENADFNSRSWNGSYTTDTAAIFHVFSTFIECGNELQIILTATANSLYIMRYDIEYEPAPKQDDTPTCDTSFISGLKTISYLGLVRLTGSIVEDYIDVKPDSLPITNEDLYYVEYKSDSTATIRHHATNTYIGLSNGSLTELETHWSVALAEDSTFTFYVKHKNKYYSLQHDPNKWICIIQAHDSLWEQHWALHFAR